MKKLLIGLTLLGSLPSFASSGSNLNKGDNVYWINSQSTEAVEVVRILDSERMIVEGELNNCLFCYVEYEAPINEYVKAVEELNGFKVGQKVYLGDGTKKFKIKKLLPHGEAIIKWGKITAHGIQKRDIRVKLSEISAE